MTEPQILLKESLRVYDSTTQQWKDGALWAKSDCTVQSEISNAQHPLVRDIPLDHFTTTTRPQYGNFDFVFVINTEPESIMRTGPRFACKELKSCERWISLLNLLAVRKKMKSVHPHPLTDTKLNGDTSPCGVCKSPGYDGQYFVCEFCVYKECAACYKKMKDDVPEFVTCLHHPHPLIRLNSARGKWISSEYKGTYQCDRCDAVSNSALYHCVECGDYDLCPKCTHELPEGMVARVVPIYARKPEELRLNEQFLSPVIDTEDNTYSLVDTKQNKCPAKMSMITSKCFNLNEIDTQQQPTAYIEVTFKKIDNKSVVGVGIGNQIFGQNNFLGHQQNSFGVFSNGTVSMNSPSNQQSFPSIAFGEGDTIGIGVMKDSFNQRTVFFTKNGKKIGIFEWRVHTGMDCFPGVSFAKESGVVFSVNVTGPFKCDLSQVAEPRVDKDLLSTLPTEINEVIGAYCATSEARVKQLREVNKLFSKVMLSNRVWRILYLQQWPNQNKNLKVKSWQQFYRKRKDAVKTTVEPHVIEGCDFEFECPVLWENLKSTTNAGERFCNKCQKPVYSVTDVDTLNRYTEMGRCVALYNEDNHEDVKRRPMKGKRAPPKAFVLADPWK